MNRFTVVVGEDFEVEAFNLRDIEDVKELSRIDERRSKERVRVVLSYGLLSSIASALLFATGIGLYDGTFDETGFVWSAAALPLGLVLRSYFDKPAPT